MKLIKKILIIGFGSIGKRHTNNLLEITNSNIIIFSKRTNIPSKEFINYSKIKGRIQIISEFDKCLQEKPDVAFITNETNLHVHFAIKLAEKGVDLFIEKPLSNSLEEIDKLNKIVKKNNITSMIGCNLRFYPPIKKIKELVDNRIIGKIISVQTECSSYLPDWHPYEDYRKGYAAREDLGGGVTLTQIHELDYLMWMFGNIKKSASLVGNFSDLKITTDDLCVALLRLENDIIIELHLDYFSRPYYKRIKIRGVQGLIYWNSEENKVKVFRKDKRMWDNVIIKNNFKLNSKNSNQMYISEIEYFLKCLGNGKKPMNSIEKSIKVLKSTLKLKNSKL